MKRRNIITIIFIALGMASCSNKDKSKDIQNVFAEQESTIVEVDTMCLSMQTFQKQILCNGRLSAIRKAELMCPRAGEVLQSVNVQNGQYVAAGALLAVSDTRERKVELDKAQHDLNRAKVELQDKLIGLGYDGSLSG